ncbi:transporter [Flavobacterium sp.]|uniref:transporter n=1 Tax=Flavobacterium sp. TaxID=239 RepID=UPI0035B0222C
MRNIIILFFAILSLQAHEKPKFTSEITNHVRMESPYYFGKRIVKTNYFDDCDACGCSASGGSMGFASMLNSNFVGVRYFNQQYRSNDGLYSNSPWLEEQFNTVQIWARIPIMKGVQLSTLLPYHFHNRDTKNGNQEISGLGDITVLGLLTVYQTHRDSTVFKHNWQIGTGLKMPTGAYKEVNAGSVNPSFQVGTGSWDWLFSTEYVLKYKKIGINTMMNYVVKTQNKKEYRFGNQFNYGATFYYLFERKELAIAPQLGLAGEVYSSNYQYGQKVRNTTGDILFGKFGLEIGWNRFSLGATYFAPINQNLMTGLVEANSRWSLNLNYKI